MSEPKILNPETGRLMAVPHPAAESKDADVAVPESVGAVIKNLREGKGLSQKKLADKLGIAIASVNKWEKGKVLPNNMSLGILDDFFESDLERRFGVAVKTEEVAADESVAEEMAPPTPASPKNVARQPFPPGTGERVQVRPTLPRADSPASCAHCSALSHMAAALGRLTEFLQAAH